MQGKILTWGSNSSKFFIKEVTTLGSQIMVVILHCNKQLRENGVHSDEKFVTSENLKIICQIKALTST